MEALKFAYAQMLDCEGTNFIASILGAYQKKDIQLIRRGPSWLSREARRHANNRQVHFPHAHMPDHHCRAHFLEENFSSLSINENIVSTSENVIFERLDIANFISSCQRSSLSTKGKEHNDQAGTLAIRKWI